MSEENGLKELPERVKDSIIYGEWTYEEKMAFTKKEMLEQYKEIVMADNDHARSFTKDEIATEIVKVAYAFKRARTVDGTVDDYDWGVGEFGFWDEIYI